ncbi:GNAT family N-acetyltransferase [Pseudomaricurvus alkylphenolicus]|uniref:GNAT family N-acetyltransferase n=1 Tax=Pseudomaricurvus alkylphenolicus TaxID=1306991 RepID=UPI0014208B6E|nr:GNAT family N-acetyltransferase [Pseudomaricurvus alkylphenolicus]NIB41662.1 GNAT family N-acetyltransferase [Pseudomaricurvus alkylphenolicus]
MTIAIRSLTANDYAQWAPLFEGYCAFYEQDCDTQKKETMWGWLQDPEHMLEGVVAEDENGNLLGLAHFHEWPISIYGCNSCYLSDLFVSPAARGKSVGETLYRWLMGESAERGWPVLTLLTQDGNRVARGLYDKYGEKSEFGFYITPTVAD